MVRKSKGYRSRTRKLLKKPPRMRGVPSPDKLLYDYKVGEQVVILIDPSIHKGQPHKRFHGKNGKIIEKRGRAYVVALKVGSKIKKVIVRPEHLRPLQTA
ncbi:MAG: 50S ribosomal protein L21e [Candidatus Jordarchaeales archaeon]|nr:50S ribosomal protein L21e [Candidatus Jordarchaeia archaeon]